MKRRLFLCLWMFILLTGCAAAPNVTDSPAARTGVYPETQGGTADILKCIFGYYVIKSGRWIQNLSAR